MLRVIPTAAPRRVAAALLAVSSLTLASCEGVLPTQPEAILRPASLENSLATDLFISEYVEGNSNNKAIEIYNGTPNAVNLAAGGYNLQFFFNGNTSQGLTINLTGTVAPGDVYVVAPTAAGAAILGQADQTSPATNWFNGDDYIVLRKGSTVLDTFGQLGFDPGTEWGTGLVSTADNTLRRKSTICTGDTNGADVFVPSTEWDGFATDVFSGLGAHTATCSAPPTVPAVTATTPANGATDAPVAGALSVTFNTAVALATGFYDISCAATGARTATVSGGPTTFGLDIDGEVQPGESCTVTIFGSKVSNATAPAVTMASNFSFSFSAFDACTQPFTEAFAIQGSGSATPLANQVVTTQGVVVGDYEGASPALRGFYLQSVAGDGSALTSDAVFVFNGTNNSVNLGDVVRVTGRANEFQDQTQVSDVTSIVKCVGTGSVTPVDVTLPVEGPDALERVEGMLVRLPQTLSVTEHFQLGRFGQVVVSSGGRLQQPTDVAAPGAAAQAIAAANALNRLIIDDASQGQNPDPILFGRNGAPLSALNTLRGGDQVTGAVGVMTYTWAGNAASGNAFRVRPLNALGGALPSFTAANERPVSAPSVGGTLRVASINLLNYFNSFTGCRAGVNGASTDCRGADNAGEFARQKAKSLAALVALDADIIGVIEVENDGYGSASAIQDIVDGLNGLVGAGTYAFIDADAGTGQVNALGTDAIKVGLLYRTARVTPTGVTAVLNTTEFVNGGDAAPRNRPILVQGFQQADRGRVLVGVTHLKSKGSACAVPDAGDGQGECNLVRRRAVELLQEWLATDPTDTGEEDVLLVGDFNAYSMEDPITTLTGAGYRDLVKQFAEGSYSYAFDGQWGSLDHALASATLAGQVTGAADFHINADEPSVLDYNTEFKSAAQQLALYSADAYRSADHDPVVVGLQLAAPAVTFEFSGLLAPYNRGRGLHAENAGRAIPLRFNLGADYGTSIFLNGYPAAREVSCTTGAPLSGWSPVETAGESELSTDGTGGYTFVWKTDREWAGKCLALRFRFVDESQQTVGFRFR